MWQVRWKVKDVRGVEFYLTDLLRMYLVVIDGALLLEWSGVCRIIRSCPDDDSPACGVGWWFRSSGAGGDGSVYMSILHTNI